jgi:Na+-transporting methylmalonyl-CoA/oxaloacetate decarboxylase gamma subunit
MKEFIMKKFNIFVTGFGVVFAFLVLIACNGQGEKKSEHQNKQVKESTVEKTYYHTCPMASHKHIANDKPGDCPECGMKLVPAVEAKPDSADYYGCPMSAHSHIRHEKPGKCEECNMNLKPMHLVAK